MAATTETGRLNRLLKKPLHSLFQRRKPKTKFPACSQNQGLANPPLILVAHPLAPQAVFQQPAKPAPLSLRWSKLLLVCLGACLAALACPAHAQFPGKLLRQTTEPKTLPQPSSDRDGESGDSLEAITQKLNEVLILHEEIGAALAAQNPPSYASLEELQKRQIQLFATRVALESWQVSLINIQKTQQAEHDLAGKIQGWSGFDIDQPYPLNLADQLAAEIRSKQLELQTEQMRTTLEESQVPGYRKEMELAGPEVRKAAEALEKASEENEPRLRWLLQSAEDEQAMAEARLQAALSRVKLNKLRVSLLEREIEFLEEKLLQTLGKTHFPKTDLEARLQDVNQNRRKLQKQLAEAERLDNLAQEQVSAAREKLEREIAGEGPEQILFRQLFELRQVEADTAAQRVETLKLLLAANSLKSILWQERFRIYQGPQKNKDLAEVIQNIDTWQQRVAEFKNYFNSRSLLIRTQIQTQNETLNTWPEQRPGKQIELAKRDAYQARLKDLEQLIASAETIEFLTARLRAETSTERYARSLPERLKISLTTLKQKVSAVWNFEVFAVDDTIIADGKVISARRPVTLKKLIYVLLLLTVGIWLVGRTSKLLSRFAQRRFKIERNVVLLFEKTGQYLAVMIVIVVALSLVQIPLAAFAFLGGALAIGVGFGGQNLISNFMSSLILLVEKPLKVGDVVEAEGVLGRVIVIGARCSTIRRFDGVDLLVPNSHLLEKTVVNRTLSDNLVRYDVKVGVAYGSPTREVFHILEQAMAEHGQVLKEPKPLVLLEEFGSDALLFGIYYWIEINERFDVRIIASDLRHRIDRLFREAGISIAFPQRDVHLDTVGPLKVQMLAEQPPEDEPTQQEVLSSSDEKGHLPD